MCPHSRDGNASPSEQRRIQILDAAMACFARRGFHQTTMHDISHEAGISVGLIYRYFESKEQVIATMAAEHLTDLEAKLEEARRLPTLLEALEKVLWCDEHEADVSASFVVDLFAEAGRNAHVRQEVARVQEALVGGVTSLIAAAPEAAHLAPGLQPRDAAQVVFQAIHGQLFDEIVHLGERDEAQIRLNRADTLGRLWSLLFPSLRTPPRSAMVSSDAP